VILNQYSNEDNPLAHEYTTGPEIIDAIVADYAAHSYGSRKSSGKVDAVIIGAGTGGTITGVSRAIKKVHNPDCLIVGVDPVSLYCSCD
jgi:cystathionine beta-synthase